MCVSPPRLRFVQPIYIWLGLLMCFFFVILSLRCHFLLALEVELSCSAASSMKVGCFFFSLNLPSLRMLFLGMGFLNMRYTRCVWSHGRAGASIRRPLSTRVEEVKKKHTHYRKEASRAEVVGFFGLSPILFLVRMSSYLCQGRKIANPANTWLRVRMWQVRLVKLM